MFLVVVEIILSLVVIGKNIALVIIEIILVLIVMVKNTALIIIEITLVLIYLQDAIVKVKNVVKIALLDIISATRSPPMYPRGFERPFRGSCV